MLCASCWRHQVRSIILTLLCLVGTAEAYGSDTYNSATNQLTIPSVLVLGGTSYTNVVITVGSVVSVAGGTPSGSQDVYDPATNQLTIPSVLAFSTTYTNVLITVGSVVSVGGTGGNASACFNPALSATGTTSDVFYQNTNGTSVNTSEIQSVVLGPQTFNGQSAIQTATLLISAGGTQTSFSYTQVQGLNVLTLGSVTTIAANYTVTSVYNPPLQLSYSLASGQSITTTGTLTSTTVIGVLSTSSTYPSAYTYTFNGFEDVTVPAGTFAGACKWTVSSTVNGIANTGTTWITRKGILVKTVAGASISVLTSGTLNGGPVGP